MRQSRGRASKSANKSARDSNLVWKSMVAVPLLLGPGSAVAAPLSGDACPVEVVLAGADGDVAAIRSRIRELLEADAMTVVSRRVESVDPQAILASHGGLACATIWIDLRRPDEARVYLMSSGGERFVMRRVPLPGGLDELRRESIGQIVESSAAALVAGEPIGVSREEAALAVTPPPSPARTPPERRPTPRATPGLPSAYRVEVGYGAAAIGPGPAIDHGPMLGFMLHWGGQGPRAALAMEAQYDVPLQATTGRGVDLLLEAASLRLEAGPELPVGPRAWVGVRAGAGLDVLRVQAEHASAPGLELESTIPPLVIGVARATLIVVGQLSPQVEITAAVFVDAPLDRVHFDVGEPGAASPDLTLWPVRPGVCLTLRFGPESAR